MITDFVNVLLPFPQKALIAGIFLPVSSESAPFSSHPCKNQDWFVFLNRPGFMYNIHFEGTHRVNVSFFII